MCGIAGCYQQTDGHKIVDVMSERIAHRGPDAAGTWSHDAVVSGAHETVERDREHLVFGLTEIGQEAKQLDDPQCIVV